MLYINEVILLACDVAGQAHRTRGLKVSLCAPCTVQAFGSSSGAAKQLERRLAALIARAALERGLGHNKAPAALKPRWTPGCRACWSPCDLSAPLPPHRLRGARNPVQGLLLCKL